MKKSEKKQTNKKKHGPLEEGMAKYSSKFAMRHGHHQMVNNEIRLIMFFAAKDREILYNKQKQDLELTVAQIMNSLV